MAANIAVILTALVSLLLLATPTHESVIQIAADDTSPESNKTLQYYLCTDNQLESDTTLMLSPGTHSIDQGPSCTTANINNLTITSSEWACITCTSNIQGRNFIFLNITNLTIENINVTNCGSRIPQGLPSYVNDTFTYIDPKQKFVFLFSRVTDLRLSNFVVTHSFGFSVLAIDLRGEVEWDYVTIKDSDNYRHPLCYGNETDISCSGSGAMFIYSENLSLNDTDLQPERATTTLTISNSVFVRNSNSVPLHLFLPVFVSIRTGFKSKRILLTGATGLGFHLAPKSYNLDIRFISTDVSDNSGYSSPLAFFIYNALRTININIESCRFSNNRVFEVARGGAIVMLVVNFLSDLTLFPEYPPDVHEMLYVHNTTFVNNSAEIGGAAYFYFTPQNVSDYRIAFDNVTFIANMGDTGSVLEANTRQTTFVPNSIHFLMNNVIAIDNTLPGNRSKTVVDNTATFVFLRIFNVTVKGSDHTHGSVFSHNAPGVFLILGGNIYLKGEIEFSDNRAVRGGALSLYDYALLFILEGSRIKFNRNSASEVGGAIYANSLGTGTAPTCVFQIIGPSRVFDFTQIGRLDLRLRFINNTAVEGGNSIYVHPLYSCSYLPESSLVDVSFFYDSSLLYNSVFDIVSSVSNGLPEISSVPYQLCFCTRNETLNPTSMCMSSSTMTISIIPGQKFLVHAFPVDRIHNVVSSVIFVDISDNSHRLESAQNTRQLNATVCTAMDFNVRGAENTSTSLSLYIPGSNVNPRLIVEVNLEACPPGFVSNSQGATSFCICDPYVTNVLQSSCNFENYTIARPTNSWLGVIERDNGSDVVYVQSCPIGLCNLNNNSGFVDLTQKDPLCQPGRTGILCGRCKGDLSVVFGSSECRKCSNFWLFTIFFYAAVGILLVLFLFLLNITVSQGTLNGVIFYVNILSVDANIIFPLGSRGFLFIWVSLVNLELGFPLCFYDGMDEAAKNALQCIFPVYLLLICVAIIVFTRRFRRIAQLVSSHGIQVLATLIYLSFSKMLRYVIDILSFATLKKESGDQIIWLFDGNFRYFTGSHTVIVIIPAVITLFFIAAFTILMLFIKQIEQYSFKLKPLMDAYAGPFRDRYRFWIGIRLVFLTVICTIFAIFGTDNPILALLIQLIFLVLFMVLVASLRPFRNKLVNSLDIGFMFDLFLIILFTLGAVIAEFDGIFVAIDILIAIAFVASLVLIGYHLVKVIYSIPRVKNKCKPMIKKLQGRTASELISTMCMRMKKSKEVEEEKSKAVELLNVESHTGSRGSTERSGISQSVVSLTTAIDADSMPKERTATFSQFREPMIDY